MKEYIKEYIILIIIALSTNIVAGFNSQDIEWGANVSGTLYKGNTLTNGEYTINVTDFTSPVQGMQIIENNQKKIAAIFYACSLDHFPVAARVIELVSQAESCGPFLALQIQNPFGSESVQICFQMFP